MRTSASAPEAFPDQEVAAQWAGRVLNVEDIVKLLPHRPPFLLVDKIVELVPGERAVGVKGVTMTEPYFVGHFPQFPVMPGVLIIEALAQVSGVVLLSGLHQEGRLTLFTGINDAKFRQPVRPGDLLQLEAVVERAAFRFGNLVARMKTKATVDGKLVAEALSSFALVPPE